jgi:predicted transcriptional regulator
MRACYIAANRRQGIRNKNKSGSVSVSFASSVLRTYCMTETSTCSFAAYQAELVSALRNGQTLRDAREKSRISQIELARACGLSQGYLSQLEHGERELSEATAWKVWEALVELDRQTSRSEILVRLQNTHVVVTERSEWPVPTETEST